MESLEDTINEIYSNFKSLNDKINESDTLVYNLEDISQSIDNYEKQLKNITNVVKSIEEIKNQIQFLYSKKIKNLKNKILKKIDNDKLNDCEYNIELTNITNCEKYKNKKYCKLPVIVISETHIESIVNSPIYLIKETNEYCIKINNKLIKGNIGNIVDKNSQKIKKCNRLYCDKTYYGKKNCKYYHIGKDVRNFPSYSWSSITKNKLGSVKIYNNNMMNNNYDLENTRFLGSLSTLNEDIVLSNKFEKELRNKQLMHDLLLYQILDQFLES
jgi:hypothetical protein